MLTANQIIANYLEYQAKHVVGGCYDKYENSYPIMSVSGAVATTDDGEFNISEVSEFYANQGAADAIAKDVRVHGIDNVRKAAECILGKSFTSALLD